MKIWSTWRDKSLVTLLAVVLAFSSASWAADDKKDKSDINKRIEKSAELLSEIMGTPDKAIPDKVMSDEKFIAVVPSMVKIAIGFGGNHGKGIATCRSKNGWNRPCAHYCDRGQLRAAARGTGD